MNALDLDTPSLYVDLDVLDPSHVCSTVNMHDEMWYGRDGQVEGSWKIAARGKVR